MTAANALRSAESSRFNTARAACCACLQASKTGVRLFYVQPVFGSERGRWGQASPVTHVAASAAAAGAAAGSAGQHNGRDRAGSRSDEGEGDGKAGSGSAAGRPKWLLINAEKVRTLIRWLLLGCGSRCLRAGHGSHCANPQLPRRSQGESHRDDFVAVVFVSFHPRPMVCNWQARGFEVESHVIPDRNHLTVIAHIQASSALFRLSALTPQRSVLSM
jgi:hypothetical protein